MLHLELALSTNVHGIDKASMGRWMPACSRSERWNTCKVCETHLQKEYLRDPHSNTVPWGMLFNDGMMTQCDIKEAHNDLFKSVSMHTTTCNPNESLKILRAL